MKKIFSFCLAVLLGGALLVSCDDDSTNDVDVHGLQVLSASTSFPSAGGTQNIAVAQVPVESYSNDSWATVAQDGQNIAVTVSQNTDIQSRHTTVVIKSSAQDSAVVDIDQLGTVFTIDLPESALYGDSAQTMSYKLNSENPVTASSDEDWITASVVGDSLVVSVAENTTGRPRSGTVTATSAGCTRTMTISQDTFDDWTGYYAMIDMQNSTDDSLVLEICTLQEYRSNPVLYYSSYRAIVPVTWDQTSHLLTVTAGTYAGRLRYGSTYYYLYMDLFTTDRYYTWSNSVTYDCPMTYDADIDNMVGYFQDNGSYSGKTVCGVELDGYTSQRPSGSTNEGYWMISYEPALLRLYTFAEYDEYYGAKPHYGRSLDPEAMPQADKARLMARAKALYRQMKK